MKHKPSYNPESCCGSDCYYFGRNDNELCWGNVGVSDEEELGDGDFTWIHECEGHSGCYFDGEKYKEEPN